MRAMSDTCVPPQPKAEIEAVDVLIVGAGLSGIGAAWHLQRHRPGLRYLILEGRHALGGTWDLFRYPGVRSDSDMHTLGYHFRPWLQAQAIADGPAILQYIRDTAHDHGITPHIRYGHRVRRADWSSASARWTVQVDGPEGPKSPEGADNPPFAFSARVMHLCSGYYDYEAGYLPTWPGMDSYQGRRVHPQHWPADLDCSGLRVVVIGSGATAVTLVPELAKTAAHVTLLQRSPTYIVTRPREDAVANRLRAHLPAGAAYALTRWKNVLRGLYFYGLAQRKPAAVKAALVGWARQQLGPGVDVERHFTPRYNPWDQRVCLVPDGDLFQAMRSGRAEVVTDEIAAFTENGLRLRSGTELTADVIVTATGLQMKVAGGIQLAVDGRPVDLSQALIYKGLMYSDVPNLAFAFGYTNASWTLKCDLTAAFLCRVIRAMDARGMDHFTPRRNDPRITADNRPPLAAGYMQRAQHLLPKQGSKAPWKLYQNYLRDLLMLRFGRLHDGSLVFGRKSEGSTGNGTVKTAVPRTLMDRLTRRP